MARIEGDVLWAAVHARVRSLLPGDALSFAFGDVGGASLSSASVVLFPSGYYAWTISGRAELDDSVPKERLRAGARLITESAPTRPLKKAPGSPESLYRLSRDDEGALRREGGGSTRYTGVASDLARRFAIPFDLPEDVETCDWRSYLEAARQAGVEDPVARTRSWVQDVVESYADLDDVLDDDFEASEELFEGPERAAWRSVVRKLALVLAVLDGRVNYVVPTTKGLRASGVEACARALGCVTDELREVLRSIR